MANRVDEVEKELIDEALQRTLTPRQERFVKELVQSPGNAKEAAIRAGYSPRSASVRASRLLDNPVIQHELAQHFLDQEKMISESLAETLVRLRAMVQDSPDKTFLKAAKLLMEYAKLAVPVLGLEIKKAERPRVETGPIDLEAMIRAHEEEIAKLRSLLSGRAQIS